MDGCGPEQGGNPRYGRDRPWPRARGLGAVVLVAVLGAGAAGCGGEETSPEKSASQAASAASKAAGEVATAASSAAARAQQELDKVKGSTDAKRDVRLGDTGTDGEGRTITEVTAANRTDKTVDYLIDVNFRDESGNLLDTVVVNIKGIDAGKAGKATARSHRKLTGDITVDVGAAVRY